MSGSDKQIVTANDLLAGDVIYFDAKGDWTRLLSEALIVDTGQSAEELLALAETQQNRIVGPYLIEIDLASDKPAPLPFREKLRDTGPSTVFSARRSAA